MKFELKIRGNQSPLVRSLQAGDYSLKIVVVDMPHHSKYGSTRKLAKVISTGEEDGKARPFMKQFFQANKSEITKIVAARLKQNPVNIETALLEAGYEVTSLFTEWVMNGGVEPGNTPATIQRKGHDITLVGSLQPPKEGMSVTHLIYAVQPVVQLRDKRKR